MSADKYPCIFSRQKEAIVYIVARGNLMFLKQILAREVKLRGRIC